MRPARIVLVPELTYSELDAIVSDLGWTFVSGPAHPPLVGGEPEFAAWRGPGEATLVYTCNPVAWLRVLDMSGVHSPGDRLALVVRLPLLDSARVARMLRSGTPESVLLGVLAADVLGAPEHLSAVRALIHHPEPAVATAAQGASVRLAAN